MSLIIRKAKISDLLKTFEWANEKEIIKNSIKRSQKVSLNEHTKWFKKYIFSKHDHLFIATLKNQKIGLVRLDFKKKYFYLSYLVDKNKRNMGFGYKLLDKVIKKHKKKRYFQARVKKNNLASNLIFTKLGFEIKYKNLSKNTYLYRLVL
tara:strand:- start:121 stop:570 length:450 start_codon:yes stop_codon:yes gene_type:complete